MEKSAAPRTAVVLGLPCENISELESKLKANGFRIEQYENAHIFLSRSRLYEHCLYIIFNSNIGISAADLIRFIRGIDKVSLIYSVSSHKDSALLKSLEAGADYSVKPPLNAKRILVEACNHFRKIEQLTLFDFSPDLRFIEESFTVLRHGKAVRLSQNEYKILRKMFNDLSAIHERNQLCECLGEDYYSPRVVDVHISSLRRKLVKIKAEILTYRGRGYKLSI